MSGALTRRHLLGTKIITPVAAGGLALGMPVPAETGLDQARTSVSVRDFGAACDGAADDTAAVQRAIDACNSFARAKPLLIPGRCRITSSLKIDRPVDTRVSQFLIHGDGEGAGFYVDRPINLFDSNLISLRGTPVSEFVTFENIHFESSNGSIEAYVLTSKFLRINFVNCLFQKIKVGNFRNRPGAGAYAQDFTFICCNFRYWEGDLFHAPQFFALAAVSGCLFENGGAGFVSDGNVYGFVVSDSAMEGAYGPLVKIGGGFGIKISGNYTESNANPDYVLTDIPNKGSAHGVVFEANFMQVRTKTENFFNVILGDVRAMFGAGNHCTGNLYDDTGTAPGELLCHDSVEGVLNRSGRPVRLAPR